MSGRAMAAVLKHSRYHNTPDDFVPFRILMAIAELGDLDGVTGVEGDQSRSPSRQTIADLAKVHKNTLDNWLPIIAEAGELSYEVYGNGRGRHTVYRLLLPLDDVTIGQSLPQGENIATNSRGNDVTIDNDNVTRQLELLSQQIATLSQQVALLSQHIVTNGTSVQRNDVHDPILDPLDPLERGEDEDAAESDTPPSPPLCSPEWFKLHDIPAPETEDEWRTVGHPAVVVWIQVLNRWPGYVALPHIIATLGDNPDRQRLKRVWDLWLASGYSPKNIAGILDRYQRDSGGNGNGTAANGHGLGDLWQKVVDHAKRGKVPDEPLLLAAVKAVGWRRLQDMTDNQQPFMRKEFTDAYTRLATAPQH